MKYLFLIAVITQSALSEPKFTRFKQRYSLSTDNQAPPIQDANIVKHEDSSTGKVDDSKGHGQSSTDEIHTRKDSEDNQSTTEAGSTEESEEIKSIVPCVILSIEGLYQCLTSHNSEEKHSSETCDDFDTESTEHDYDYFYWINKMRGGRRAKQTKPWSQGYHGYYDSDEYYPEEDGAKPDVRKCLIEALETFGKCLLE